MTNNKLQETHLKFRETFNIPNDSVLSTRIAEHMSLLRLLGVI